MQPTEILMQEHRVIEQVLACLEKMADQCAAGQALDTRSAEQALDFFRNFADRCHHGKEEDLLFPLMESKGFSREQGPTGVMLHEHEQGRRLVQAMTGAVSTDASDADAAREAFIDPARQFVALLREHIHKEDHCLFPMANQALTEPDQQQLVDSFEKVEHDDLGPETHQRYVNLANELAERFGVEPAASAGQCGHGCSHGDSNT
ncbi:MAG: hemerythrin domain-containing protein [Planctomycetota bacterium]|nr:hemerythrin domain-containing protein [Planctomycetota bacterium]